MGLHAYEHHTQGGDEGQRPADGAPLKPQSAALLRGDHADRVESAFGSDCLWKVIRFTELCWVTKIKNIGKHPAHGFQSFNVASRWLQKVLRSAIIIKVLFNCWDSLWWAKCVMNVCLPHSLFSAIIVLSRERVNWACRIRNIIDINRAASLKTSTVTTHLLFWEKKKQVLSTERRFQNNVHLTNSLKHKEHLQAFRPNKSVSVQPT